MGHFVFLCLHLVALLFLGWGLLITLPAHLIYIAVLGNRPRADTPTPDTHVTCPACAELVKREARVCKHCGCKLVPQ